MVQVKQSHYEELLAEYCNALSAISLLKQYRPYLELLPSMRRPDESIITIPLPVVRVRDAVLPGAVGGNAVPKQTVCLPCDIAILMCDPEWKVKLGAEIIIFIHRPGEDFSNLLGRWRQTQVWLDQGYEWLMPLRHQHILSEEAENIYPLFVLFAESPERIKRGLKDAYLPFVVQSLDGPVEAELSEEIYSGQE